MNTGIRPMESRDREQVVYILNSTPEFTPDEVEVAEELIDSYLDRGTDSGYYIMVLDEDGGITGYICYGPTPLTQDTWDIYWIAVAMEKRGHGWGRVLLEAAEREIARVGGRLVIIETSSKADYEKTRRFYRSHEYEQIACIPDFYTVGDDKLILQKRL